MADSNLSEQLHREQRRVKDLQKQVSDLQRGLEREIARRQQAEESHQLARQLLERLNPPAERSGALRDLPPGHTGMESVYDSLPLGLWAVDTNLCLLSVNKCAADLAGISAQASCGRQISELDSPWINHVEPLIRRVLDTGEPVLDFELARPVSGSHLGQQTWLVSCHPLRHAGGVLGGVCGIMQDVTAQKQSESVLRQTQSLQAEAEKLAATGRMAARIAHEINNPLAGIKNAFSLIKKAIPVDHPRYEFVPLVEKEIDRIAEIVRQMYDLHRPNQDAEQEVLVWDTIRSVVTMLGSLCRRHGVTIAVDMPDPTLVACAPEHSLRQILYNLLDNAIEASPSDSLVKIRVWQAEEWLWIQVADHGQGIPEGLRSRVFEPFFTTKERGASGGLGLGLAICKGIIEALQGSITIQSELGRGSVFCVKLPCHRRGSNFPERSTGLDSDRR